ncbi:uncharacterized protein LOC119662327 [Teleopsis dalmanni]|uniref:uncharacterized protein LOC119662327 n=1 Tax=Teleopsis dalmanni TaxID=139649 RepID=UPI000D32CDCE|nr:uncharacterized protein LOC119662327 [Teleopsis dalmanni]
MDLLDIRCGCGVVLKTTSDQYFQGIIMYSDQSCIVLKDLVMWQQDPEDYEYLDSVLYFDVCDIADFTRIAPFMPVEEYLQIRSRQAASICSSTDVPKTVVKQNQSKPTLSQQYTPPIMLPSINVSANTSSFQPIRLPPRHIDKVSPEQFCVMEPFERMPPLPALPFAERQHYLQQRYNMFACPPIDYNYVHNQRLQHNDKILSYNAGAPVLPDSSIKQVRNFININNINTAEIISWRTDPGTTSGTTVSKNPNITSKGTDLSDQSGAVVSKNLNVTSGDSHPSGSSKGTAILFGQSYENQISSAVVAKKTSKDSNTLDKNAEIINENLADASNTFTMPSCSFTANANTTSLSHSIDGNKASSNSGKKKKGSKIKISSAPSTSNFINDDNPVFVTEKGLLVPSISLSKRYEMQAKLAARGVTAPEQNILFGQRITDLIVTMLHTCFEPKNNIMNATGAILCARNESAYELSMNVVLSLATIGLNTFLHISKKSCYKSASNFEMHRHYRHFQVFSERCQLIRNVRLIPRADFVVLLMQANHDEKWTTEVLAWVNRTRAPVLVVDPPTKFNISNSLKYAVLPILPVDGFQAQKYIQSFLCNLNVPNDLLQQYTGDERVIYEANNYSVIKILNDNR